MLISIFKLHESVLIMKNMERISYERTRQLCYVFYYYIKLTMNNKAGICAVYVAALRHYYNLHIAKVEGARIRVRRKLQSLPQSQDYGDGLISRKIKTLVRFTASLNVTH